MMAVTYKCDVCKEEILQPNLELVKYNGGGQLLVEAVYHVHRHCVPLWKATLEKCRKILKFETE